VTVGGVTADFNVISTSVVIRCEEAPAFRRGDSNANGTVDISDSVLTLNYLFADGPAPTCQDAVDTNDDGTVDIADPVYSLSFLFLGGPVPVEPFGECGRDPTEDGLDCASFPACR